MLRQKPKVLHNKKNILPLRFYKELLTSTEPCCDKGSFENKKIHKNGSLNQRTFDWKVVWGAKNGSSIWHCCKEPFVQPLFLGVFILLWLSYTFLSYPIGSEVALLVMFLYVAIFVKFK